MLYQNARVYWAIFGKELEMKPVCIGCGKHPEDIEEYVEAAAEEPNFFESPDDFVRQEEGTYNPENGHFLCTDCYVAAGMPSSPRGWQAP